MKVGKHTLLIDGNYFVFSRLFVMPKPKSGKLLEDEKVKGQFMRKLAIDFASEMRKLSSFVDDVVVAVDSKSWRKDLYPESDYKGTRKQDSSVDWNAVYNIYEQFQDILKSKGVTIHQTQGAEADDVLFGWSTMLNGRGKSCIVWTGDRDLIQLVNYSEANDAHTIWYYNTRKSLYVFEGFTKDMEDSASSSLSNDDMLFNMGGQHMMRDRYQSDIMKWISDNKIEVTEVDCDTFILKKILTGDKSDNIPSVVTWQKEMKGGKLRNYSITEIQADKIVTQFLKENNEFKIDHLFSADVKASICDIIYRVIGHSNLALIQANLNNNISLMLLHTKTIPDSIQNAIYETIDLEWEGAIDNMEAILDKDIILKGTSWLKGNSAPANMDPFANLEVPKNEPIKKIENKSVDKEINPKTKKLSDLF
jgi:5'-3' exonuclease